MKKLLFTIILGLGLLTSNAQIEKLAGPRIGLTFVTAGSAADHINTRLDADEPYGSTGSVFITQYGWQWESRFADGGGDVTGIVEWIALVGGMEKGIFLPSVSSIIGARTSEGFEIGVGPNLSLSGIGMVFGLGHNFKSGNLNFPVNLVFVPGIKRTGDYNDDHPWDSDAVEYEYNTGARISIMIGFNMSK